MMTDPIADLLTRVRNANAIGSKNTRIPHSTLKENVVGVLKREGYITGFSTTDSKPSDGIGPRKWLIVDLKYGEDGEKVIVKIQRVSRPGRRVYRKSTELKPVLNGLGIRILSTSKGLLSDREARKQGVGGEIMAEVH